MSTNSTISETVSRIFRDAFQAHPSRHSDPALALSSAQETASEAVPAGVTGSFDDETLSFVADSDAETGELAATIHERGNGLPDPDSYVPGNDGELYRVVRLVGPIHTSPSGSGAGNYIRAIVELAAWEDCAEDDEFPAQVVLEDADQA